MKVTWIVERPGFAAAAGLLALPGAAWPACAASTPRPARWCRARRRGRGPGPYPPRTIPEVDRLNQDDIVEVEGTFYAPPERSGGEVRP